MTLTAPTRHVIERRMYATEFREVPGSNGRQRWARAVTYGTVDDYGTVWLPSCFNAGLAARMPTILYGHDWYSLEHVLGAGIDFRDVLAADQYGGPGCDVLIEFADPEQVPSSRLAMTLTTGSNPPLRDVSVGFDRQQWLNKNDLPADLLSLGAEEAMQEAVMDELSIVVRGAVPGASLRGRRSWVIDGEVTETPPTAERSAAETPATLEENVRAFTDAQAALAVSDMPVIELEPEYCPPEYGTERDVVAHVLDLVARVKRGDTTAEDARAAVSLLAAMPMQPQDMGMRDDMMTAVAGVDAALDAAVGCCADMTGWPTEAVQMAAYCQAADVQMDDLMEAMGIANPDENDGPETPATGGQMAGPEPEHREPDPPDPDLLAAVERAKQRSR